MKQTTLVKTMELLEKKQLNRFLRFVRSEYFNQNEDIQKLVAYLQQQNPRWDEKHLQPELIFEHIYEKQQYDFNQLKHLFSYTLKLLERFLAFEQFQKDPFHEKINLLQALRDIQATKRFVRHLQFTDRELQKTKSRNYQYLHKLYLLSTEGDLFHIHNEQYKRDSIIQQKMNHLDTYYISEKLKNACEMLNRQKFMSVDYDYKLLSELIDHLEAHWNVYEQIPSITIYYKIYKTLVEADIDQHYEDLIAESIRYQHLFPQEEIRDIFFYSYNYCIRKVNQNQQQYLRKAFQLMQTLLENKVLFTNNELLEWHYKNISSIGIRLQEFDWVNEFLEQYKSYVPEPGATNAYYFNKAYLLYEKQDFDQAQMMLHQVAYSDIIYKLDARTLLLKIYYDKNETESLLNHVEAFKRFIKRNDLLAEKKYLRYYNFFNVAHRLYRVKTSENRGKLDAKNRQELEVVKNTVEVEIEIGNKQWLKDRIAFLEK